MEYVVQLVKLKVRKNVEMRFYRNRARVQTKKIPNQQKIENHSNWKNVKKDLGKWIYVVLSLKNFDSVPPTCRQSAQRLRVGTKALSVNKYTTITMRSSNVKCVGEKRTWTRNHDLILKLFYNREIWNFASWYH